MDVDNGAELGSQLWVEEFAVEGAGHVAAVVYEQEEAYLVEVAMTGMPASTLMHWGVNDWNLPSPSIWPEGTNQQDDKAVQTSFHNNPMRIRIPKEGAPGRLVFVLKVVDPEEKWHNNGNCFNINVKAPSTSDIFDKALDAEGNWSTYTLMARYQLAMELLGQAEKIPGGDAMGFIYSWLRLSNMKLLDWYRNGNYQPKDMGHVQKTLAEMLGAIARTNADPVVRHFARLTVSGMSRGGGDSEQIRLEILNILRRNGIREGHRPGIEDHFLEAWHQKLHSNTTVEDIAICEAYIHFQCSSGDPGEFWSHLWEYGGISRERMANMKCGWRSDGIKADPGHMPHVVNDFKHYLWILKTVHAGSDLETMVVMSQGDLDDGLKGDLWEVVHNREEWWVAGKALECRQQLENYWRNGYGGRDVMLLDCALEKFVRLRAEQSDLAAMSGDELCGFAEMLLKNGCIAAESEDLGLALAGLQRMMAQENKWSEEGAMAACATVERAQISLAHFMDVIFQRTQPHAELIGKTAGVDERYLLNFGEEAVRGHPMFYVSIVLQHMQTKFRAAAGLSPWQVVSNVDGGAVVGKVLKANLEDIQGEVYDTPTVLVSGAIGGLEDIPQGIVAVLVEGTMDVLSHVAIRARNQGVMCVSCTEAAQLEALRSVDGTFQKVTINADGSVSTAEATAADAKKGEESGEAAEGGKPTTELKAAAATEAWVLQDGDFTAASVGGKSLHVAELRRALVGSGDIMVPPSVALPFGTFEKCLAADVNKEVAATVAGLQTTLAEAATPAERRTLLGKVRAQVSRMTPPPELEQALKECSNAEGMEGLDFSEAWTGTCAVWASQWNERAWLSRRAMGLSEDQLRMACLLQPVVPAKYAFVLHTANPLTGNKDEMLGEMVVGLGETLVSNTPGRALAFSCAKDGSDVKLLACPSKRTALFPPSEAAYIARSDSNAEDLEDFAGAGLYDSIILGKSPEEQPVSYADEPLLWDKQFQLDLISKLAKAGEAIEKEFGGVPQDVEGAIDADGKVHIVQSRPEIV